MKVFITGGTGFIGRAAAEHLRARGFEISILTRSGPRSSDSQAGVEYVKGNPVEPGDWGEAAGKCDAVINLAGATIFQRWTEKNKREIYNSRIAATRNLVQAIAGASEPPNVLLSASAVGYYGAGGEEAFTETSPAGSDFLANVTVDWEKEALAAEELGVRVCLMRFGVVLGRGGGALTRMLPIFKMGLGGRLGSGRQWFSWIHLEDLVQAVGFLLESPNASGPYNFTAPGPVTNSELTAVLGKTLHRPTIFPAPGFMIRTVMGEMSSVFLTGQRVIPANLIKSGFKHNYDTLEKALQSLLQ